MLPNIELRVPASLFFIYATKQRALQISGTVNVVYPHWLDGLIHFLVCFDIFLTSRIVKKKSYTYGDQI